MSAAFGQVPSLPIGTLQGRSTGCPFCSDEQHHPEPKWEVCPAHEQREREYREAAQKERAAYDAKLAKERRERIVTAVLSGFAASHGPQLYGMPQEELIASRAAAWADALIAELDK